jgi:hypothetical protein
MPIMKARMSKAEEQAKYFACLAQLQKAGCDVRVPGECTEDSPVLDIQIAPPIENRILELATGGVAYAIRLGLVALRAGAILTDFGLAAPWDPDLIPLCPEREGLYSFAPGFDFGWDEVLNHRFKRPLRFHHRGGLVEGWLLALGQEPIPKAYRNGRAGELEVGFTDQFGHDHIAQAHAFVERSARRKARALRPSKSSGLWEPLVPDKGDASHERSGNLTCRKKLRFLSERPLSLGLQSRLWSTSFRVDHHSSSLNRKLYCAMTQASAKGLHRRDAFARML